MTKNYHKANLKKRILTETKDLIKKNGYECVSVRIIASTIGVSPTAIYRHYENLNALMLEVVYAFSVDFATFLKKEGEKKETSIEAFKQISCGFVSYSIQNKYEFELLFQSPYAKKNVTLQNTKFPLVVLMNDVISSLSKEQNLTLDKQTLFIQLWSFIFGFTMLIKDQDVPFDRNILMNTINQLLL